MLGHLDMSPWNGSFLIIPQKILDIHDFKRNLSRNSSTQFFPLKGFWIECCHINIFKKR